MPWHTVLQGEHLTAIAHKYGFSDPSVLFDHGENKPLKEGKRDVHVLHPGDKVWIPEKEQKEVDAATGKLHSFKIKLKKLMVRVIVHGEDDAPLANKPYKLTVDGKSKEGQTGDDGKVEAEIPITARGATLVVDGNEIPLRIGHLDPVVEETGVLGRLANLGYDLGGERAPGPFIESAIRTFQKKHGLRETGTIDDALRDKLKEIHGA